MSREVIRAGNVSIPLSEISFQFARSGGPGGQNVNKVETKVEVRFKPADSAALSPAQVRRIESRLASRMNNDGEIIVVSEETRYRERNRQDALQRLANLLTSALATRRPRKKTRPTRGSKERRLRRKKRRGEKKRLRRPPKRE